MPLDSSAGPAVAGRYDLPFEVPRVPAMVGQGSGRGAQPGPSRSGMDRIAPTVFPEVEPMGCQACVAAAQLV